MKLKAINTFKSENQEDLSVNLNELLARLIIKYEKEKIALSKETKK